MANNIIKGITVEIGGDTTKLGEALADVEKDTRSATKELREVEKALKRAPESAVLWQQKQELLNRALEDSKRKLQVLEDAQADVERQFQNGEIDGGQYRAFQRELESARAEVGRFADEIESMTRETNNAADSTEELGDSAEKSTDGFTVAKGVISDFISNGIQWLIGKVGEAKDALLGLPEATREYRAMMASLENSSKRAGYSSEETAETLNELQGVLGDSQAAATTTANLQAIGLEQERLQELTKGVIGAWATYGDSIPIDGLAEAVNETVKVGQVTGSMADVLNWAGLSEDKFNESLANMSTEAERADYILSMFAQMGLTQSGQAWEDNNESIIKANQAQADFEEQSAKLGEKLEPITAEIQEGFADILEKVVELIEKADFDKIKDKVRKGFDYMINTVIPLVKEGFNWIIEHKEILLATLAAIAAGFLAFKVVGIISSLISTIQMLITVFKTLNITMSANVIGIVIGLVAALVAAFITLWNTSDEFRQFWIDLWEKIKSLFSEFCDSFVLGWETIIEFVKGVPETIQGFFEGIGTWFSEKFTEAYEGIKGVFNDIVTFVSGIWDSIKTVFTDLGTAIGDTVGGAIKSVINGVLEFVEDKVNTAIDAINSAIDFINGIPGVDLDELSHVELPRLAKGGVLHSGAAVFAEAGPELLQIMNNGTARVTPLSGTAKNTALAEIGGRTVIINNKITVDKISNDYDVDRLSERLSQRQKSIEQGKGR